MDGKGSLSRGGWEISPLGKCFSSCEEFYYVSGDLFLSIFIFSSSSSKSVGFPKVYCLSFVNAAQSSRMCIAVSFSSASLQ